MAIFFMEVSDPWRHGVIGHASMEVAPLWKWVSMDPFFVEVAHFSLYVIDIDVMFCHGGRILFDGVGHASFMEARR